MKRSTFLIIGTLLVLALLLAACGSNSNANEIAVGNPAPAFELTDSDGKTVTLAEYKDQPVLLFFHMAGG